MRIGLQVVRNCMKHSYSHEKRNQHLEPKINQSRKKKNLVKNFAAEECKLTQPKNQKLAEYNVSMSSQDVFVMNMYFVSQCYWKPEQGYRKKYYSNIVALEKLFQYFF